jgi:hypothetical protein
VADSGLERGQDRLGRGRPAVFSPASPRRHLRVSSRGHLHGGPSRAPTRGSSRAPTAAVHTTTPSQSAGIDGWMRPTRPLQYGRSICVFDFCFRQKTIRPPWLRAAPALSSHVRPSRAAVTAEGKGTAANTRAARQDPGRARLVAGSRTSAASCIGLAGHRARQPSIQPWTAQTDFPSALCSAGAFARRP